MSPTKSASVNPASETLVLRGHVVDSGVLGRVLDDILDLGGDYSIETLDLGRTADDESMVRIIVQAPDIERLAMILARVQLHGANLADPGEARLVAADIAGALPVDFYSTTNLATSVRVGGAWLPVANPEMDCAVMVSIGPSASTARTSPMSDVAVGDLVVCGNAGVRVELPHSPVDTGSTFEFMNSGVSSERPQTLQVRQIAEAMRATKARGEKVLWVVGPAVVHTGAAPALAALVNAGWVDCLFAGNAVAAHDIESVMFGTSLGVDLSQGSGVEHGHENHIRAINWVRRAGSISAAVEQGLISGGLMHALVTAGKPFVLVGSVRDDGPLPEVITDVIEGQQAMRAQLPGVGYAIMVATMLHSIATGNILPGSVPLVCVDINPATVTKLSDRGSSQAQGVVTDVGLFLHTLTADLVPGWQQG